MGKGLRLYLDMWAKYIEVSKLALSEMGISIISIISIGAYTYAELIKECLGLCKNGLDTDVYHV